MWSRSMPWSIPARNPRNGTWLLAVLHQIDERFLDPNLISYSSTISSCEKSGHRWHLALQLFQDMLSDVITPDVVCYNSVISACEKGMQWQTALHFFDEMLLVGLYVFLTEMVYPQSWDHRKTYKQEISRYIPVYKIQKSWDHRRWCSLLFCWISFSSIPWLNEACFPCPQRRHL